MMRKSLALCVVAAVSACSSGGGTSPIFGAIKGVVFPDKDEAAPTSRAPLSRERITQSGLAAVRARIEGEDISNVLSATSLNGTYVTYVSAFRQSITMHGSLITATRGLGGDMLSVSNSANDPIVVPTPPENWPAQISRNYRFPGVGPSGTTLAVNCALTRGAQSQITIVEITYDVITFVEACAGDGAAFTNTYQADAKSGQIWQTQQWIGDERGYLNIEVLEPFTIE